MGFGLQWLWIPMVVTVTVGGRERGTTERGEEMIDLGLNFGVYVQDMCEVNKPISKNIILITKLKKPKLKTLKVNTRDKRDDTHGFDELIPWALGIDVRTLTLWN